MAGVAVALLAALAAVAMGSGGSGRMGYLYTDLDPSSARTMVDRLQAENVPFELTSDGTAILAPENRLAELRMSMASEQLGGKVGYEILDEEQPFGISSAREKLNETRAIEGELARSIGVLQNVVSARVHIVMPERTLFATETRQATSAVTVKTRGRLSGENIEAIRYLVSAAVPELSPESVSIVDQAGTLLARAGEPGQAGAAQADERQMAVEARLRQQIETLLEPIVGVGRVRAEVSADVSRAQSREEAEVYDPDTQVVARKVTVETGDQTRENEAGAMGATISAQLPENEAVPGAPGDTRESASNQTSEDTTYQNSSRRTTTVRNPGDVTRLSVAVMVDQSVKGLTDAKVEQLTRLVENAVGFNAERGDSVAVERMAFVQPEEVEDPVSSFFSSLPMGTIIDFGKLLLIAAVGLFALRIIRQKGEPLGEPALIAGPDGEPIELTPENADGVTDPMQPERPRLVKPSGPRLDEEIELAQIEGNVKVSALNKVGAAITENPAEAAAVIRQWMNA